VGAAGVTSNSDGVVDRRPDVGGLRGGSRTSSLVHNKGGEREAKAVRGADEDVDAGAPTAMKGGPTRGWGRVAAVAPAAVPVGAPAAATAPTARSREAAAAA
jgi:hypothetical protein